jgi:hypothetical protein
LKEEGFSGPVYETSKNNGIDGVNLTFTKEKQDLPENVSCYDCK